MLDHKTSLNKFQKMKIISRIFFLPEQYETRNHLQEENWKNHRHVGIKQNDIEQPVSQ